MQHVVRLDGLHKPPTAFHTEIFIYFYFLLEWFQMLLSKADS